MGLQFLSYLSIGSVVIPLLVSLFTTGKDLLIRIFIAIFFLTLLAEIGNLICSSAGFKGYLIPNIFFIVQFTLLAFIYAQKLGQRGTLSALFFFLIIFLARTYYFQSINDYQTITYAIGSVIMIGFSLGYFYQLYQNPGKDDRFFMWINAAVFYYFSFNIFLFMTAGYVFKRESADAGVVFWSFHNTNNIIKNCLYAVGLYQARLRDSPTFNYSKHSKR